jgi:hypothetical protein
MRFVRRGAFRLATLTTESHEMQLDDRQSVSCLSISSTNIKSFAFSGMLSPASHILSITGGPFYVSKHRS